MDKERVASILEYFGMIDREIQFNNREITNIEETYYSPLQAVNTDGLPQGKGGFHSSTETTALNVPESAHDWLEELRRQNEKLRELKREIWRELSAIDHTHKVVLFDFYIRGFQWVRIAEQLHYSTRQCQNLRDNGLETLAERFARNRTIVSFSFPA